MPFFDFDGLVFSTRTITGPEATQVQGGDGGVSFTFSVTAPTGAPLSFKGALTATPGSFLFFWSSSFVPGSPIVITLSFTGNPPSQTVFTPNAAVSASTVGGVVTSVVDMNRIVFTFSPTSTSGSFVIDALTAEFACFCAGTRIATPAGPRAVETLAAGDLVSLAGGGTTRVRWLGRSRVDPALADPARLAPVRIAAGALGAGLPRRDLRLSADHAVCLEGHLVNAGALVDGAGIARERRTAPFTYYHVETDAHELILAEGVAAESYLDMPDRSAFANGAERADAPPIVEMDLPRVSSARLVPQDIRERLATAARAFRQVVTAA